MLSHCSIINSFSTPLCISSVCLEDFLVSHTLTSWDTQLGQIQFCDRQALYNIYKYGRNKHTNYRGSWGYVWGYVPLTYNFKGAGYYGTYLVHLLHVGPLHDEPSAPLLLLPILATLDTRTCITSLFIGVQE